MNEFRHYSIDSYNGSMQLQAIGIIAIVVGVLLELFMVGSSLQAGTIIAMLGIAVFVYGYVTK